jgi:hypothetical protein
MFLRICGSVSPQKTWYANRKSTKKIGFTNRKSAIITNLVSPQACGFAIYETYFRTAPPFGLISFAKPF